MSSVVISGNTSGTITLDAPNVAGTTVLTLPTANGTVLTSASSVAASQLPTGSVLQVVSTTVTSTFSTTSTSFVDITGLSASITPSSSSNKILVMWNTCGASTSATALTGAYLNLLRDATQIYRGDASGSALRSSGSVTTRSMADQDIITSGGTYLDSPATTSSVTYKLQILSSNGSTVYINRSENTSNTFAGTVPSTITLMEIKG